MYSIPSDRFVRSEALAHRLEHGAIGPDLRVAVHAGLRWRNTGKRRDLYRCVAIATVDPEPANVMAMAEGHGLLAKNICLQNVW